MKFLFALLFFSSFSFSQIKGTVYDSNNEPIPFVNIYILDTYKGTTTNEKGFYEINYQSNKTFTIVFQCLGYKTQKYTISSVEFPYLLNVVLVEESYNLNEVIITNGINPADGIIRNANKNRAVNNKGNDKFEADFYSKGIFRAKDIPKKFMGVEVGDLDGSLDSTRSGVIYLSETVSKIKFEKPNNLKEEIIASKVAGNDKGFSYNTAINTNYDFYENYVDFGINMISPIASNAFNYYKYKLESTFYDDNNKLINKIQVIAKRDKEPVFEGYIYIVEDSWAIYGLELDIKGYRMQQPILENMRLSQNYSFNASENKWTKNLQSLDFIAGIFGMKFTGKFTHVFSNYVFKNAFEAKTFTKEMVSFANNANKKEDNYWLENRKVPLTEEEVKNYFKKDSIQTLRESKSYLDSLDNTSNKFKIDKIITGYTYNNSYKKWSFSYEGLLNFSSLSFNTVQGWNLDSGFSFKKWNEETGKYTNISTTANYGFSDDRLRVNATFLHRFNTKNYAQLMVQGGSEVSQFNNKKPISPLINTVATLFFKRNYMKLYEKEFANIQYSQEVFNGFFVRANATYENRKPLFNTTDYVIIKNNHNYFSNNPLLPYNYTLAGLDNHYIVKAKIATRLLLDQRYISRPNGKISIPNDKYPTFWLFYEKALVATNNNYLYDFIQAQADYGKTFGNKGTFDISVSAGKFFNADNISFIDYKHFFGNQTHVAIFDDSFKRFNLLPYYSHSTNNAYFELHAEHNFNGYIMNKIPLLRALQLNLIVGYHQLSVPYQKPYSEFTIGLDRIGFGKFRVLRIDYVRSYYNGFKEDGIMFKIKM